jgi:hypothetical protein
MHWNISGRNDTNDHLLINTEFRLGEMRSFGDVLVFLILSACSGAHEKQKFYILTSLIPKYCGKNQRLYHLAHVQRSASEL